MVLTESLVPEIKRLDFFHSVIHQYFHINPLPVKIQADPVLQKSGMNLQTPSYNHYL